ncbi:MAG: outer membrane protein assembly factor BamC [Pseudazoarcus pumilus]|nr:outer membrane protein assembly factor BamC [Pseudazoarcus pumilus]
MNAKLLGTVSIAALLVTLTACSSTSSGLLEGKKIDYKSARPVGNTLEVPPDLTAPSRDDRFAVPDVSPRGIATYSAYQGDREAAAVKGSDEVLAPIDNMRIERAGSERWLVIRGNADDLWPQIREFWNELGFILNVDQPSIGIMETDWAEDRAQIPQDFVRRFLGSIFDSLFSTGMRDKFRTRLEKGQEEGTVEIFISHRGAEEVYSSSNQDSTVWQPRDPDPELEVEMLRRLMVYLGAEETRVAAELQAEPAAPRATLGLPDGRMGLAMDESFDRAWRRVGLALDRVGFTVEDRDRSQGLYFVRYIDPDEEARNKKANQQGFFSRLFSRSKPAEAGSEYRILVEGDSATSRVTVLSREGGAESGTIARNILTLLQEQLR